MARDVSTPPASITTTPAISGRIFCRIGFCGRMPRQSGWTRSGRLLPYENARENEEEKHVCALQLDVIERCLTRGAIPGCGSATPFAGVGSRRCGALANQRCAIGCELKSTYYRQARQEYRESD